MSARLLVAENQQVLADAIAIVLTAKGYDAVVAEGKSPDPVLRLARKVKPDVVLLGIELRRSTLGGVRLIGQLQRAGARVIVITDPAAVTLRAACIEAGVDGLASRFDRLATLLDMIADAVRGLPLLTKSERVGIIAERDLHLRRLSDERRPLERLTATEKRVLIGLVEGRSASQIAEGSVSVATVRSQIQSVLWKLGVSSQLSAVAVARAARWPSARKSPFAENEAEFAVAQRGSSTTNTSASGSGRE